MNNIIIDFTKIYGSLIDAYNSKIKQTINNKYTLIDRAILAIYLYIKILDNLKLRDKKTDKNLIHYILKQVIYSETGNLSLDITDEECVKAFKEVSDNLIKEKFSYLNRVLESLKYNYEPLDTYFDEIFRDLEIISEYVMMEKLFLLGNIEARNYVFELKEKLKKIRENTEGNDKIKQEIIKIIESILKDKFKNSKYQELMNIALNLRDIYRYSSFTLMVPENVLYHQFVVAILSIIFSEYLNKEELENINVGDIVYKSLFHDFAEYKGNEIVAQVKNHNESTIKMFKMIEEQDELELKNILGDNLHEIMTNFKKGKDGYISELLDKIIAIIKIWYEVIMLGNVAFIRAAGSIYQERFKRFKKKERLEELQNPQFFIDLLRECFIFVKESLLNYNQELFLLYYTLEDIDKIKTEIKTLREKEDTFLA